jgi:hypothetical protein
MFRNACLKATIILVFALIPILAVAQDLKPESEEEQTRLNKDEITKLMINVKRMAVSEQKSRMEKIWENRNASTTPRSDFLFSTALAYLDNNLAQAYLGYAYDKGCGIVQDLQEAYVWYTIALKDPINDEETAQQIQQGRDRIKMELQSNYPGPSDEDLETMVKRQTDRITKYLAEIRNTRL